MGLTGSLVIGHRKANIGSIYLEPDVRKSIANMSSAAVGGGIIDDANFGRQIAQGRWKTVQAVGQNWSGIPVDDDDRNIDSH